jgi:hypothetical protein
MLDRFDDYLIHQTTDPVSHPVSGDRNHYDRYFFHGYDWDANFFFCACLALYPNRRIMDAHFSVLVDGKQHTLHASRLAPRDRRQMDVGPLSIEVIEPMRAIRFKIEKNDETSIECDMLFKANGVPVEEQKMRREHKGRVSMETSRFVQFGMWEGSLQAGGRSFDLDTDPAYGCRDRSWGVRPVGEPEIGAPGELPQLFLFWVPVQLKDRGAMLIVDEDSEGNSRNSHAVAVRKYKALADIPEDEKEDLIRGQVLEHRCEWIPGTRRLKYAEIDMRLDDGRQETVKIQPLVDFQMTAIGYVHPEWGHGLWKGDLLVEGEEWTVADLNPLEFKHLHCEQVCRIQWGDEEAVGVLEQFIIGEHKPTPFTGFVDPYTPPEK